VEEKQGIQLKRVVGVRSQQKSLRKIELLESVRLSDSYRSTGLVDRHRSYFWPLGENGRPTRSTEINRENWHRARSIGAVSRRAHMHSRARRSTGSVDRTLSDLFIQSLLKGKGCFGSNILFKDLKTIF